MAKFEKKVLNTAERLVRLELLSAKLTRDFESCAHRKNPVIARNLRSSANALHNASAKFFSDDVDQTGRLLDLASIHLVFARQLIDSDEIEASLGEADFLELSEGIKAEDELTESFDHLKYQILDLQRMLRGG